MPKEITDIRDFLQKARRRDAKAVTIKTTRGMTKFKIRCSRYLYTLRVQDGEKAAKLEQSLPPGLQRKDVRASFVCRSSVRGGGARRWRKAWWCFQFGFW